jgi:cytochrome o ubiquinol oxidase subunit III
MSYAQQALTSSEVIPLSMRGPASPAVVVGYGFWLFLLSDIILFAALFASYAVLSDQNAGGLAAAQLFDKTHVLIETGCLLLSSFTCGLGALSVQRASTAGTFLWFIVTLLLGATFLGLEVSEFARMVAAGAVPSRSAFLSAFFTLVGTHGLHVATGIAWLIIMLIQVAIFGFQPMVRRRLFCFGLFWHALDIVWVGVFTVVYLGAH